MYTICVAVSPFSLAFRQGTNNLFVVGFELACCEMNKLFCDVVVLIFHAAQQARLSRNMRHHTNHGRPVNKSCGHRACIPDIQHTHIIRQAYKFIFSEYSSKKNMIIYHIVKKLWQINYFTASIK
jgi:hypothetical protein